MKMNKKCSLALSLLLILFFFPMVASGQEITVKGKVIEKETGDPLPGVSIVVEKSTKGVISDLDGSYEIKVRAADKLVYSFIGKQTQTIAVGGRTKIDVALTDQGNELESVTVVAFGKQKKESVVSSITTVNVNDLRVPSSNFTSSLAGNVAGLIGFQRTGEPGEDNADFFIRGITTFGQGGNDPLILIDGIELTKDDLARVRQDDIESFSILKDASAAALYGARGANGVILVQTKRGQEGPATFFARVEASMTGSVKDVKLADPITYMKMYNEAISTRDPLGELMFSRDKIEQTGKPNANRIIYPANDWYDMLFKNHSTSTRADFSVRGGGKIATYYVSAAFTQDNGILKVDHRNSFNSNIDLKRYTLRSNVDINVTKTTKLAIRLSGNFDDYTGPLTSGTDMYVNVMHSDPVLFPAYYPMDKEHKGIKHIMFGNYQDGSYINPYSEMVRGYKDYHRSQMIAAVEFNQDLSFITKGLKFSTLFNLTRYSYWDVSRAYRPYLYALNSYDSYTGEYHIKRIKEDGTDYLTYSEGKKDVRSTMYSESRLWWNNTFGKNTLSALGVFTVREKRAGNAGSLLKSMPARNVMLSGRFTYAYDDRYFTEFNFGYNGSERFAKGHRWGFFPSVAAGWMLSEEKFFEPLRKYVNKLKFRVSYGLVGNDKIGNEEDRFFYLSNINMNSNAYASHFGETGSSPIMNGISENGIAVYRYPNPAISWETAKKANFGVELNLFNALDLTVEYYTEHRDNIYMTRADIPSTMGLQSSIGANIGKTQASGWDIQMEFRKNWNKNLWTSARANFTYAHGTYKVYEEPTYAESYRQHAGRSLAQTWGYIAERLFIDDKEAANSPSQAAFGSPYGGGDIKYTDVNGDGVINSADMVPIGNPTTPEINYGFGFSVGYKGFDASVFFEGIGNESFFINASPYSSKNSDTKGGLYPFYASTQVIKAIADSYWSEDNRDMYAFWPRLSYTVNYNNTQPSTWWMRDGSFIRLKSAELGYSLPRKLTSKLHMENLRLYLSGTNLICWSNFKMWDPEQGRSALNYPLQRVINIGVNITFK